MRISLRADYGARAMIDLAQHRGRGLTQTAEIASRQHIPESYLEQLLTSLRKAGLVRSVRGPAGGHELAREASEITLGDVLETLEGVSAPDSTGGNGASPDLSATILLQEVWRELMDRYRQLVHAVTIEELVQRQAERQLRTMYYI